MSSSAPTTAIPCARCRLSGTHFWLHAESLFAWGAGAFLLLGLASLALWGDAPLSRSGQSDSASARCCCSVPWPSAACRSGVTRSSP